MVEDNDAKILALYNGEIDAILGVLRISFDGYTEVISNDGLGSAIDEKSQFTRIVEMNLFDQFKDINVRKAIAYAINQTTIAQTVFNDSEIPAETLFASTLPNCNVEQKIYDTNIEETKRLLDEAAWTTNVAGIREKDGQLLEVDLNYVSMLGSVDNLALALSSQLDQIGIKVKPVVNDMITYYSLMGTSPLVLSTTYGGANDPSNAITNMNGTSSADPSLVQFAPYFEQGIIDELDSTAEQARVEEIYKQILTTIADESLLVPLTYTHNLGVWNADKVSEYIFPSDSNYVVVANIKMK